MSGWSPNNSKYDGSACRVGFVCVNTSVCVCDVDTSV